jgi:hypothetical protein
LSLVSGCGASRRYVVAISAAFALALVGVLAIATRAHAAELVYWDNYRDKPQTISVANIDGSGGGALNLTGITLAGPEGMAFDSAMGRLYVASTASGPDKKGEIVFVNVDGSGAGVLSTPGVEVKEPYGVAIDPSTRIIYWVNGGGPEGKGSIGYAKLDGSGGGLLNTSGVTVASPYKLAIDPVSGRVFWSNNESTPRTIAFANLNNTGGGGTLDLTGAIPPQSVYALAVDSAAGRVYWLDSTSGKEHLSFAGVNGGGGGEVSLLGSVFDEAYGLAFDPTLGRFYWANYGQDELRTGAIGFANLAGGGGGITPLTAPLNGAQDPVVLKSPSGAGAPTVTRNANARSQLTCSTGTWGADFPGSFVYQAPRTFAYQWTLKGTPMAGATAATLKATKVGSYACVVTAANQAGTGTQTSTVVQVKAAKVKLSTKKKARVLPGGVAAFTVKAVNQGDLKSKNARVCVKVPKKAKKVLMAPKCKALGKVNGKAKDTAKLRIKVGKDAVGTYKLTFQVRGSAGKAANAKILVSAPKKKK